MAQFTRRAYGGEVDLARLDGGTHLAGRAHQRHNRLPCAPRRLRSELMYQFWFPRYNMQLLPCVHMCTHGYPWMTMLHAVQVAVKSSSATGKHRPDCALPTRGCRCSWQRPSHVETARNRRDSQL